MFGLLIVFCVVVFALAVILWAGTLGLQGLIYSEPAEALFWRGPAAGVALGALVGVWCLLTYRMYADDLQANPTQIQLPLDTVFRFQPTQTTVVDQLWSVKGEKETLFRKFEVGEHAIEYRDAQGNKWSKADTDAIVNAIIIEEGTQKIRLEPRLSRDGKFTTTESFPAYRAVNGRQYMDTLGRVSLFHRGRWMLNILFNALHFGVWFVVLWLLLRFQWPHALGLAVVLWAVMTLAVLPMLFDRTRDVVRQRVTPTATAATPTRGFLAHRLREPLTPTLSRKGRGSLIVAALSCARPISVCPTLAGVQDVHDVAVLDDVGLAFEAVDAVRLGFLE
ncbi:hypothetical protein AYO44_12945 [Planctomycetaceae bacterium SCGC AG-212-F19]|nr:hypothetical protein AYO44_12945 [Planctomycetaceae bacterium SCGC AG-212-F19]